MTDRSARALCWLSRYGEMLEGVLREAVAAAAGGATVLVDVRTSAGA